MARIGWFRPGLTRLLVAWRRHQSHRLERRLEHAALRSDASTAARLLRRASLDVAAGTGRLRGRRVRSRLPSVAVLQRSQFTDDARQVVERLGNERVLLVSREALKAMARALLPSDTGDLTYRTVMARDPSPMLRYRDFLTRVWAALDPGADVRLVLTANTCYWAEVELGAALESHNTAFVAMHKENLKSPAHAARWEPVYRDERAPFLGRAVLVQNRGERDLQVRGLVAPAEKITVVGMARLDDFHAHRERTAGSRTQGDVLFAGFLPGEILPRPNGCVGIEPRLGLPLPELAERPEHMVEACLAMHRVAVATARALPERRIVLKTKGGERDRYWFPRVLAHVTDGGRLPDNFVLQHGGDAARMTRDAAVVAGLNTTMLLEAIAAGRPAVVLALGEAAQDARSFVMDLSGAASIVHDEADAVDRIVHLVASSPEVPGQLDAAMLDVLERWSGNSLGNATVRTVDALSPLLRSTSTGPADTTSSSS